MGKEFYKARLTADESGLVVEISEFVSIHESPCFHYVIGKYRGTRLLEALKASESPLAAAKRMKVKVYRIDKRASRIAFETREIAIAHLRFLKQKQIIHLQRELDFCKAFLNAKSESLEPLDTCDGTKPNFFFVPDTQELVNNYLTFD